MANSKVDYSPIAASSSREPLVLDPLIRAGTKFLFDFSDPNCHPGGVITPGALSVGATFTGLTSAAVQATVVGGAGMSVNLNGSLAFDGSGSANYLAIGAAGQFDMAPAEYEYVAGLWLKVPASDYTTTSGWAPMTLTGGTANASQVYIDMGTTGLTPKATVGTGSSSNGANAGTATTPGAMLQIAAHYVPGQKIEVFVNGQLKTSNASAPADLQSAASAFYKILNAGKFNLYRVWHENITASVAAQNGYSGKASSDILDVPAMILRDYLYGTGAYTGAPKTAFA